MRNKSLSLVLFLLSFGIAHQVLAAAVKFFVTNLTSSHIKFEIKTPEGSFDTIVSPAASNMKIMAYDKVEGLTATAIDGSLKDVTSGFLANPNVDAVRTAIGVTITAGADNKSLVVDPAW